MTSKRTIKKRNKKRNRKRNRKRLQSVIRVLLCGLIFAAIPVCKWFYEESFIYEVCQVEAGTVVEASDFTKNADEDACFEDGTATISTNEPGEYTVQIRNGWFTHYATLLVEGIATPVNSEVTVEAGTESVEITDFVSADTEATFITRVDKLSYKRLGDYTIMIRVDQDVYTSVLHVVDTIAPVVTTRDLEGYPVYDRRAEDFVVEIEDATDVTVEFEGTPDLQKIGTQKLTILFTDEGGNTTEKTVTLKNLKDTEPPVISGAEDITTYLGEGVSYLNGVSVTDNSGDTLSLEVDNSQVNLNELGSYTVIYSAEDASGNQASESITLNVLDPKYSEESVYELANQVLDEILTDDMTDYDIVYAIYNYTYHHISYVDTTTVSDDWLSAAYQGIVYGKGDCYIYASTAQALYNCAGITNMMIEKIPTEDSSHYWNLVDIGDGWYHVDCTPMWNHPTIFMWTDAELMAYSEKNNLSHNYDHSLYPETN